MHSVEWFYELELPVHFFAEHPHNCILGKAKYGDYFFCFHGTTVGANYREDGTPVYPVLGDNVFMCANSTIIGDSQIGNNVIVSAGTYIKDTSIPDNSIVFDDTGGLCTKRMTERQIKCRTSGFWRW
jgi:serine O-acetyltransferase